jgi:cation:H+ antiporter
MLYFFGLDGLINRLEGAILLLGYLVYYILLFRGSFTDEEDNSSDKSYSISSIIFYFILGLAVLIYSSDIVVEKGMELAEHWGVAQSFVGIAIIGLGTSLPELAVSIGAAINKSPKMTVGNIIGSNIFDSFVPIGLGGVISTTNMENTLMQFDLPFIFGATILVLLFLRTKNGISIFEGIALMLIYLAYIFLKLYFF